MPDPFLYVPFVYSTIIGTLLVVSELEYRIGKNVRPLIKIDVYLEDDAFLGETFSCWTSTMSRQKKPLVAHSVQDGARGRVEIGSRR